MNGSVVVADPNTGRVLTIVNQKLAFQPGYTPCSTIKLVTALAAGMVLTYNYSFVSAVSTAFELTITVPLGKNGKLLHAPLYENTPLPPPWSGSGCASG